MGCLRRKDDGNVVRRECQIAKTLHSRSHDQSYRVVGPASVVLAGVVDEWRQSPERVPPLRGLPEGQVSDQVEYALLGVGGARGTSTKWAGRRAALPRRFETPRRTPRVGQPASRDP